ncbi:23S rRNA (uracil(1939)-C(5))-methyltransferase RlmD [Guggenheimella bovis]
MEKYRVIIEDLGENGEGIAHIDGLTVFVKRATLGDEVEIEPIKKKKNYWIARVVEIVTPSKDRVEPPCKHFYQCGGCQLLDLSYERELAFKETLVKESLRRVGGIDVEVERIQGMEEPYHYRNKMSYPVKDGSIGLYKALSHDIVPIEECVIYDPEALKILEVVRKHLKGFKSYNEETHTGSLRHVLIRSNEKKSERMVVLVRKDKEDFRKLIEELKNLGIDTIVENVNLERGNRILGDKNIVHVGSGTIEDELLGLSFHISPHSFFQVNHRQTKKLYSIVKEKANLTGKEVVVDLYAGMGTIGSVLSKEAKHVYSVEVVKEAVRDGIESAKENGLRNITFIEKDAKDAFKEILKETPIDLIVVDPPRKGLDPELIETIIASGTERIIYVSCKPSTLARDLKLFKEGGYEIQSVNPVDMFPHTVHVETVCLMSRKEK